MDQDVHHLPQRVTGKQKAQLRCLFLLCNAETLPLTELVGAEFLHYSKSERHEKASLWSFRFIILCHIPVRDPCEHLPASAIPSAWLCFIHGCLSLHH